MLRREPLAEAALRGAARRPRLDPFEGQKHGGSGAAARQHARDADRLRARKREQPRGFSLESTAAAAIRHFHEQPGVATAPAVAR